MAEYISKQDVIDYLNGYLHSLGEGDDNTLLFDRGQRRALINAIQDISAVKAADVQPVKQWISCKEQMPEDGISILICSERGTISKATYDSDMGYFYIADSELHYNQLDITHWQPLPEPSKGR